MLFKLRQHLYIFIYLLHKGLATAKSQGDDQSHPAVEDFDHVCLTVFHCLESNVAAEQCIILLHYSLNFLDVVKHSYFMI